MKKLKFTSFFLPLLAMLFVASPQAKAEGEYAWPANYGGVMMQGFYWDSFSDSKWKVLESQAAELSAYFDIIWVPNSGKPSGSPSMGYDPVYWFSPNHNSSFGTEEELKSMISTFKNFGTGIIEDVVVNHRAGVKGWADFPAETYKGKTYQLGLDCVCKNDEMAYAAGQPTPTGANDTGDNFDGYRDLDHTNATVQENVKAYLSCLKDLGYVGFRYDMVKGFAAKYIQIYNQSAKPTFSVGEYWDGYDNITNWIKGTGYNSAAFDFPFKYAVNEAFANVDFSKLVWKRNGVTNQPAGLVHMDTYTRYAVTFIDNHDTFREGSKFTGDVDAANAYMMCSPGTPCVLLAHWLTNKASIKKFIAIRKSVGLTNQSTVNVIETSTNRYVAEVTGTNGKLLIKVGRGSYSPSNYTSDDKVAGNALYSIWTKVPIKDLEANVAQLSFSPEPGTYSGSVTVKFNVTGAESVANKVVIYTTDGSTPAIDNGTQVQPGSTITITKNTKLKATVAANGKIIAGVTEGNYITKEEPIEVYVQKPASWSKINLYAWNSATLNGSWPGKEMTETVEYDGITWYRHSFGTEYTSVNVIFNDGTNQTVDIENVEFGKHFFTLNSDSGKSIAVTEVPVPSGSVNGIEAETVKVYPNPATNVLRVATAKDVKDIAVYSVSGVKVAQSESIKSVNVADLQGGLYIYNITFGDGQVKTGKFIKK